MERIKNRIETVCIHLTDIVETIFASDRNTSGTVISEELCSYVTEMANTISEPFFLLLSPYQAGVKLIIVNMTYHRLGTYLVASLNIPFGMIIDGDDLAGMVYEVLYALRTNRRNEVERC